MLVQDFLSQTALRLPDKVALICGKRRYTYGELDAMSSRLAHALVAQGVQRGDRVAIHLPNSMELVVGLFAALKAGGCFVLIHESAKHDKRDYILNNARATALLMEGRGAGTCEDLWAAIPSLKTAVLCGPGEAPAEVRLGRFQDLLERFPATAPKVATIDLDLAALIYTSGSTGEPKGVMSDHSNIEFASHSILSYLGQEEADTVLCALPLSFDYGLYQVFMTFRTGGTLVLERSFTYPAAVLQRIQEERVTGFPGVPTLFTLLLQMDRSAFDLSSLRFLTNTAAALPPGQIRQLQAAFPGTRLFSMYGLTETKRTLYLPPEQLAVRPDSVGIAIPGTEVWIEDEAGRRLGPGEIGELVVRGRHVMRGYWEAPEATARRYRPGPLPGERLCYSSDLFRMDEEGFLYFVSRRDDIIKCGGQKVAPKEVENVLHMLPGVLAAVIGVPDPVLGQAIKAVLVQGATPLTEKDVIAHCRAHLEDYMVPRFVEFVASLPMTSSGKISKIGLT